VVWLVARNVWEHKRRDLARQALELVPGVSQQIRDFRRVKMQDGRKVWEVAAKEAQYYDAEHAVVVRAVVLQWFLDDGRVIGLTGDEGRIVLAEHDVTRVN